MIEVYLNGKKSITQRNYIEGSKRGIRVSGSKCRIRELTLWEMDGAYKL